MEYFSQFPIYRTQACRVLFMALISNYGENGQEDEMLLEWKKQLLHDKEISHAKQNLQQLSQVSFLEDFLLANIVWSCSFQILRTRSASLKPHSTACSSFQILEMHNMEGEELAALNLWGLNLTKTSKIDCQLLYGYEVPLYIVPWCTAT